MFSVLLYAAETRTLKKDDENRYVAYEMKRYGNMIGIGWQEKKSKDKDPTGQKQLWTFIRRSKEATVFRIYLSHAQCRMVQVVHLNQGL